MVPRGLRTCFIIHFWADVLFALPLLVDPWGFLGLFGWTQIDPISARLVGAALVGIGVESLLGRDAPRESYLTMLRLKVLWSSTATIGIGASMFQGAPTGGWIFFAIFAAFCGLWNYWRWQLARTAA